MLKKVSTHNGLCILRFLEFEKFALSGLMPYS